MSIVNRLLWASFFHILVFVNIGHAQEKGGPTVNIALVAADNVSWVQDVQQKLIATGQFSSVSIIQADTVTPTLSVLQAFDAVLVWSDIGFQNSALLGDNLADYVDSGGGVVVAVFTLGTVPLSGRFNSTYQAITQGTLTAGGGGNKLLGTIFDPGHPILNGVTSFDGGTTSFRSTGTLTAGATRIADWTDGNILIATKDVNGTKRADLGFFPPSTGCRSDFWVASTDGDLLMANALLWVSSTPFTGNIVSSVSPLQNELSVDKNTSIQVVFTDSLNPATVTASNIDVTGTFSGVHTNVAYDEPTKTLTITPDISFTSGEVVRVTLTSGIESPAGNPLTPFTWEFVVESPSGSGIFGASVIKP